MVFFMGAVSQWVKGQASTASRDVQTEKDKSQAWKLRYEGNVILQ